MNLLVAVKSCIKDLQNGSHDVIRKTWGKYFVDVKFFIGRNPTYSELSGLESEKFEKKSDEIQLDCGDEYLALSHKTQAICKWSVENGYDAVYLCDNDTFVIPAKLKEIAGSADYIGYFTTRSTTDTGMYAFGGTGYILSRKAAIIVANAPEPTELMEDHFVGDCLMDRRDIIKSRPPFNQEVAWHFPKNTYSQLKYDPKFPWQEMMEEQHITGQITYRTHKVGIGRPPVYETVRLELAQVDR